MHPVWRATFNEAISVARCVIAYPQGFLNAGLRTGQPSGDQSLDTPVLLVHGYGHNSSAWLMLRKALRRAGFTSIHAMNYNPLVNDVPQIATKLSDRVEMIRGLTEYAEDVRTRRFPGPEHTYGIAPEELHRLHEQIPVRQRA